MSAVDTAAAAHTAPAASDLDLLAELVQRKPVAVPVRGLARPLHVRPLGTDDVFAAGEIREALAKQAGGELSNKQQNAAVVAMALCNADGQLLKDPRRLADVDYLAGLPWAVTRAVLTACGWSTDEKNA